ncbi:MAG: class B sortase [Muricomes sp.]
MKKKIYMVGLALSFLLFVCSIYQVIGNYAGEKKAKDEFKQLAETVEQADEPEKKETEETENQSPLEKYRELFRKNQDLAGWILVEGTQINFPVMYTPNNPDYYLKHNFEGEYSDYGVPYIAEHCDPYKPSDNVIIYGHHMNDGSMFAGLMEYETEKFYEDHKIIQFDTLTEQVSYEVIAVFKTTVYDDTGFKYYLFANAETAEDYQKYVEGCKPLSLYDTGVTATYGDKLLTLSTCEYSNPNGRLVVVAKKVVE